MLSQAKNHYKCFTLHYVVIVVTMTEHFTSSNSYLNTQVLIYHTIYTVDNNLCTAISVYHYSEYITARAKRTDKVNIMAYSGD